MKEAKIRFKQAIAADNEAEINRIRRCWRTHKEKIAKAKNDIDLRYESLRTRLEGIISSIETRTMETREKNKKLRNSVDSLARSVGRARAAASLRQVDEKPEIEVEINLRMQVEELKQRLQTVKNETKQVEERKEFYQAKYLNITGKQHKLKKSIEFNNKINQYEVDRKNGITEFRKLIEEELVLLTADAEEIRKIREDLLHPPIVEEKPHPKKQYQQMLMTAGQWDPMPMSGSINMQDNLAIEDVDPFIPQRENDGNSNVLAQKALFENNIRTLLATGNYTENDPIIISLKKQIDALT